jgi:hypothetical protein
MRENIKKKIELLYDLSSTQLMDEYTQLTGESYFTRNRKSLIRKIAWLYQTKDIPPLSQMALDRVDELVKISKLRIYPHRDFKIDIPKRKINNRLDLQPGTILTRKYNGKNHEVVVLDRGFLWNNNMFKSISAVAKAITGTHWNGKLFFGLK